MKKAIFVAGTDTDIGKTTVSKEMAKILIEAGKDVAYYKPVQSGGDGDTSELKTMGADVANSYTFDAPLSPHLASERENVQIDRERFSKDYREALEGKGYLIVEGAGGLIVPIIRGEYYLWQMIDELEVPVLLVTELRVGGINHTLLSCEFLKSKGLKVAAIYANRYGDSDFERDNKEIVERYTGIEVITEFKGEEDIERIFS